jgi:ubiquinone/menaquinone biosynthesis C-methylase UbiE
MPSSPAPDVNHWHDKRCARAFWTQRELPPYRELLRHTTAWLGPGPGERWLDLGCGSGQLTRALWQQSAGQVGAIVALDCAAANDRAIALVCASVKPPAPPERIRFQHADFSDGLGAHADSSFDGVCSGLAIQYAQSWSAAEQRWTTAAYDHLLTEVCRVLRPGGRFVFSVNRPNPAWLRVALYGVPGFFVNRRPIRYVRNSLRMLRYGAWLKREARRGRFHYLPLEVVLDKLARAGFASVEHRLSFARQAHVIRARRL